VFNDDVETGATMSGGDVDVKPFLISRNTLGNRKNTNSKSQMSNGGSGNAVVVAEVLVKTR